MKLLLPLLSFLLISSAFADLKVSKDKEGHILKVVKTYDNPKENADDVFLFNIDGTLKSFSSRNIKLTYKNGALYYANIHDVEFNFAKDLCPTAYQCKEEKSAITINVDMEKKTIHYKGIINGAELEQTYTEKEYPKLINDDINQRYNSMLEMHRLVKESLKEIRKKL